MAGITAADVKALREKTGLPMMDCKRALQEAEGDRGKAVEMLRKAGAKTMEKRAGRTTSAGRIAVYTDFDAGVGSIVELRCESAPVAANEEFVQLANDLARQLATGPGAAAPDELLAQTSPGKPGQTLMEQLDELTNRIREVFRIGRMAKIDGRSSGYVHHTGASGAILQIEGDHADLAKEICMHVVAMRPEVLSPEDLDPAEVERERNILAEQARAEGKPEKIIEKMVEGRMRKEFYAKHCLTEQVFVKAEDGKSTVGKVAKGAGLRLIGFVHFELPRE